MSRRRSLLRFASIALLGVLLPAAAAAGPPGGIVEGPHGRVPGFPVNSCEVCHDIVPGTTGRDAVQRPNETCLGCHTDGPTYGTGDPFIQDRPNATAVGNHAHLVTGTSRFLYGDLGADWPFVENEQEIHCTSCHDPHRTFDSTLPNPSTTNTKYIRNHTDDYRVSPLGLVQYFTSQQIKVTDLTGPTPVTTVKTVDQDIVYQGVTDFADGIGLLAAETDVCEVCHTATNHHQVDDTAPGGQSHFDGEDCTACHTHPTGFAPSGGQPLTGPHAVFGDPDCGVCHDSSFFPGQPDNLAGLASVFCATCHDPATEASLHGHLVTGTTRFEYDVECTVCHDQHGWSAANVEGTDNVRYVKARITTQLDVVDNTAGGALVSKQIDHDVVYTGPATFIDGDANFTEDICSTCHTLTNHHQNDGTAPGGQSHFDGEDCTACHAHENGFTPVGGQPLTGPHAAFGDPNCGVCHDSSFFPGQADNPAGLASVFCATCHDPATEAGLHGHLVSGSDRFEYEVECTVCHDQHGWDIANVEGTDNLKYVKARITAQLDVVDNTAGGALVTKQIDHDVVYTGPATFVDGDATFTEDVCSTCHTLTNHHQNDGTAPGGQSHFDGQDCRACHAHENGFGPQLGAHPQAVTDCSNCHLEPDGQMDLVALHGGDCSRCHPGGFSSTILGTIGTWNSECSGCHNPAITQTGGADTPTKGHRCVVCHGQQRDTSDARDMHRRHAENANCVVCHGFIPDMGVQIGSSDSTPCLLCHSSATSDVQVVHWFHRDKNLSCLECHGGVRPAVDVTFGPPVGQSEIVCEICHHYINGDLDRIHEDHTRNGLGCGYCHADANLQDDRLPMPPRDDGRRALVDRTDSQECELCHGSSRTFSNSTHVRHVADQFQWCYNCHTGDDGRPAGETGPITQPDQACELCHSNQSYTPDTQFSIHRTHASKVKCYVCHQTRPPLLDWPIEWLGGSGVTAVDDPTVPSDPRSLAVSLSAHPNPFNPQTTLTFAVRRSGPVSLTIYDVRGQVVQTLIDRQHREVGEYQVVFRAEAPSGVYLAHLITPHGAVARKIVLAK